MSDENDILNQIERRKNGIPAPKSYTEGFAQRLAESVSETKNELRERNRVLEEQNRILREGLQYYATDTIWGCTDCAMHVHVWPGKDCRADISEDEFGYEKAQEALKAAEEVK